MMLNICAKPHDHGRSGVPKLQHSELSNLRFSSGPQNLLQSRSPLGLGDLGWPYLMRAGLLGWGTE